MQEELNQFERNNVYNLVPLPKGHQEIGTKLDENGIITWNIVRLVAKEYNQEEGIDYEKTYVPVAQLEAIRYLLTFACWMDFKLYEMDVKTVFLNSYINEEVYVSQPPIFENFENPNYVFKWKWVLYKLKQAPRTWYECLSKFLFIENTLSRGKVDTISFIKHNGKHILLVYIFVDNIIFGLTNNKLYQELFKLMQREFKMSMMRELNFFQGLQIKQIKNGFLIT